MDYLAKRSISCAELARRSTKIQELLFDHLMPCPRNKHNFRCDQNGPSARREEGAYPERYVTDPAGAGQPPAHFHRHPLGRGQLAVFPRCSFLTYRFRYDRRSRLEKQPTDLRRKSCLFRGQDISISTQTNQCPAKISMRQVRLSRIETRSRRCRQPTLVPQNDPPSRTA